MKNLSGALAYIAVGLFVYLAVTKGTHNPEMFLNIHGIAIVFGGLLVATFASFPFPLVSATFKTLFHNLMSEGQVNPAVAQQLVEMGSAFQKGLTEVEKFSSKIQHRFLAQSVNLVLEGLNRDTVSDIILKRIEERQQQIQSQMNVMLTLSKYSPALGLAATVLGLVDLLSQLQSADMAKLGLGMAIALSATFYGIIMSNLVFAPLSEMIAAIGEHQTKELLMIHHGVCSAMEKKHSLVIGEIVNSYLDEDKRIDFVKQNQSRPAA